MAVHYTWGVAGGGGGDQGQRIPYTMVRDDKAVKAINCVIFGVTRKTSTDIVTGQLVTTKTDLN